MDTTGEDGVTITPIFWAPEGSRYHFPADYQDIINGYISDIAADSGSVANVYSVATEYYDADDGGDRSPIRYQLLAGDPIVDTNAYPDDGCGPAKAYTACLTDSQMRDELLRLVNEQGLATDLGHIYPVFLPPKVQTEDLDGTYSGEDFCGYHRAFDTTAGPIVYGNEPFIKDGCGIGQAPNGSLAVDGAINSLSHELSEALTDPLGDDAAWLDSTGTRDRRYLCWSLRPAAGSHRRCGPRRHRIQPGHQRAHLLHPDGVQRPRLPDPGAQQRVRPERATGARGHPRPGDRRGHRAVVRLPQHPRRGRLVDGPAPGAGDHGCRRCRAG